MHVSPMVKNNRSKNPTPANKKTTMMREYGYNKLNSVFMNEKVADQEPNYGNTASKGIQMTPRGQGGAFNSPSNANSNSELNQLRRVHSSAKQHLQVEPSQERLAISINQGPYLMAQGQDLDPSNIGTDHGSAPISPTNNTKNLSRSLYGQKFKQSSQITLTDNEMADLEKIKLRPDFQNKGLTQSNFVGQSGEVPNRGEESFPDS